MNKIGLYLKNILFPPRCIFCRKILDITAKTHCCADCINDLPYMRDECCPVCGRPTPTGNYKCWLCAKKLPFYDKNVSVFKYRDSVKRAIINLKFYKRAYYANTLGEFLAGFVRNFDVLDVVTAVPISAKRQKARGYNQSELLAKRLCQINKIEYQELLEKYKDRPQQSGLKLKDRQKNCIGAYRVLDKGLVKGKNILLIDDVYTTGSTVNECAKVLHKAGALHIFVLTLAMTIFDDGGNDD